MVWLMFYTFFCLPAALYSQGSPCYYKEWERTPSVAACLCKDVPKEILAAAAKTTTTTTTEAYLKDFYRADEVKRSTSECEDPLRDTCTSLFLPDFGGLSKCLYRETISCNVENPLDGLKPLIMCTYKTFRAARTPPEALKKFANVLYSLLELSNVPQLKQLLESGLKLVNNSAPWEDMPGVLLVKMPNPVAAMSHIDAVGSCPIQEKSIDATLVCSLSYVVKNLKLFGKDMKWTLMKSAEALVCVILKSYLAEKEISQPSELFEAVRRTYYLFSCENQRKSK